MPGIGDCAATGIGYRTRLRDFFIATAGVLCNSLQFRKRIRRRAASAQAQRQHEYRTQDAVQHLPAIPLMQFIICQLKNLAVNV
jgi:hypothetical protein